MNDMIPADPDVTDDDRELARQWATNVHRHTAEHFSAERAIARVILSHVPAPARPTLADMPDEERAQHVTGQVDVDTPTFVGRGLLVGFYAVSGVTLKNAHAMILTREWQSIVVRPEDVTPRPDLPRLEWPGDQEAKAAPAPALPEGWRLADHKERGRVIVTSTTPNAVGHVAYVLPATDPLGYDWFFCSPSELKFLDTGQKPDTTSDVPPNTLAKGSEWGDIDALTRACRKSRRGQIVVVDCQGDVSVWSAVSGWWKEGLPSDGYEPFTILHAGKGGDQ